MRHLSVPCKQTSHWMDKLRESGWLATSVPVTRLNEYERAIPLSEETPLILPEIFAEFEIIELEIPEPKHTHYLENLKNMLGKETLEKYDAFWPKSYDQIGDLIIFKLKNEVKKYSSEIGSAIIQKNPNARLALLDGGVMGEYRIRKLRPLAIKNQDTLEIQTIALEEIAEISTKTTVRENGFDIIVDPRKAYYSPRLSNERLGTLKAAIKLSEKLDRPLYVADPYAGVGPSIVPLICEKNLVNEIYASDINPQAVELLKENIEKHSTNPFEEFAKIEVEDARNLLQKESLIGKFDLLLVNIPHDSLEHLQYLFPLLSNKNPSLLRGWALIDEEKRGTLESKLLELIDDFDKETTTDILIEELKSYSFNSIFVRFEIYFGI